MEIRCGVSSRRDLGLGFPLASATSRAQLADLLAAPALMLDEAQIARLDTAAAALA